MNLIVTIALSLSFIMALLVAAGIFTWVERRGLGLLQERLGPNRVGPLGFFQWIADTVKLIFKADEVPPGGDRLTFRLAPALAATPVLAGFAVVAVAPGWTLSALDMGVIFALAMLALTVYAMVLGAWASRNRYAMLGGLRAAAQMLSYEAFFGLSLMGVVMIAGTLNLGRIVAAQEGLWFVFVQPLGAVLFTIAGIAAAHRLPFDLQESEQDLVAGFMTEYSGMSFALFFLGEYLAIILVAALATTLFFGGWLGPWLPGPVWFGIKTAIIALAFVWIRAILPRPRYDQLVAFAWKFALPLALVNLLATGFVVVLRGMAA
jgi:NADH-quinone oxidoreductase subunit H